MITQIIFGEEPNLWNSCSRISLLQCQNYVQSAIPYTDDVSTDICISESFLCTQNPAVHRRLNDSYFITKYDVTITWKTCWIFKNLNYYHGISLEVLRKNTQNRHLRYAVPN